MVIFAQNVQKDSRKKQNIEKRKKRKEKNYGITLYGQTLTMVSLERTL